MKRWRVVFFALPLIVCLLTGGLPGCAVSADGQGMVWKGSVSGEKEKFIKVVETPDEWTELWKRAFDQPGPAVDFKKYVVACVFLGHSANWLYAIHIGEPFRRGDTWVVSYELVKMILELSGPFKAGGQYHMKVLEKKKDAGMVLEKAAPSFR